MKKYNVLLISVFVIAFILLGACVGQFVEHRNWFHYSSEFNLFELIYFIGSVIIATYLVYLLEKGAQDSRGEKDLFIEKFNEKSDLLDMIDWTNPNNAYLFYAMLKKQFDYEKRFIEDLRMLLSCDCVIFDAREKRGVGVGTELTLAKINKIPIYAIVPPNSHYRKNMQDKCEWLHPFVAQLSDKIFDDINTLIKYLNEIHSNNRLPQNNLQNIDFLSIFGYN